MLEIEQLIQEHKAMDELAQALLTLVKSPDPHVEKAFSIVRRLSAYLDEHLAAGRNLLYANHSAAVPGRLDEEAAAFERALTDLKEDWALYLHEWIPDNIGIDWRNFSHATQWIINRLRERIAQESDILYPLTLHQGGIRLRTERMDYPAARLR